MLCRTEQYKKVKLPAEEWYENTKEVWQPKEILFIATDERNKTFFDPIAQHHELRFLDDYFELAGLGNLDPNYFGMIDTIVASRGRAFAGTWFSTFTGTCCNDFAPGKDVCLQNKSHPSFLNHRLHKPYERIPWHDDEGHLVLLSGEENKSARVGGYQLFRICIRMADRMDWNRRGCATEQRHILILYF